MTDESPQTEYIVTIEVTTIESYRFTAADKADAIRALRSGDPRYDLEQHDTIDVTGERLLELWEDGTLVHDFSNASKDGDE